MAMYTIKSGDKEYGPVNVETLRQWIEQGRVHRQTPVRIEGTEGWTPLLEFSEFQGLPLKSPPAPPAPPQPAPGGSGSGSGPKLTNQRQGLAITSLILGIASTALCLGIITGLPAIVMGHIAHSKARRFPESFGGTGFAIAGFALGYVSLALTLLLLPALLLPALAQAKAKAKAITCVNQMRQIGLAARLYSNDHDETFPPDFMAMSAELISPKILICPSDEDHAAAASWADYDPDKNLTYLYLAPGIKEDSQAANTVILTCPIHNHKVMSDGSVIRGGTGPTPPPY